MSLMKRKGYHNILRISKIDRHHQNHRNKALNYYTGITGGFPYLKFKNRKVLSLPNLTIFHIM